MAFVAAEIAYNLALPRAGELIDKMHPLLAEDVEHHFEGSMRRYTLGVEAVGSRGGDWSKHGYP